MIFSGPWRLVPETEMGSDAVKILVEPVACENWQGIGDKPLPDLMEKVVGISRGAATDMKGQDKLALGSYCCPDPNAFSILFPECL